jgi:acetyl-CoA C-acetyltransferase
MPDLTLEDVRDSPMLWDPIRFHESCPSSDGACAVVISDRTTARRAPRPVAWIHGLAVRSELASFPGRNPVRPQAGVECAHDVYRQAGITDPRRQVDVAELYVPFSWYEPMWLEGHDIAAPGEGWRMVDSGETDLDGAFPVNPSGGVLATNAIGASGMLRFAEAALQVRGLAGEHQIEGARTALAQAYGGAAQYFAMGILRSDPPELDR